MPKAKKKNVGKRKPYTATDIQSAMKKVNEGQSSILAASKAYHIPYTTLYNKIHGISVIGKRPGPNSIFTAEEEQDLIEWIFKLSKHGFPVTKSHLLDSVQRIVRSTNKVTPFTNGRPSKHWYQAFLRRHPEVSEKMCQNLPKRRASVSEEKLRGWFHQIQTYLSSKNLLDISPQRVFNLDESSFYISPKNGKVLVKKGERAVYNVCDSDKESYTALIGGNAAGDLVPTMIIYKYERIPKIIAQHFPSEFVMGKSESGWMTSETFYCYIVNHLYPWCLDNNIEFPIIIYVDGHSSHLTKALSDFCCDHSIELIALFPNATHLMQPMDVCLFRPLKETYREAIRTWRMEHDGQQLNKVFFPTVLRRALNSLDLKKIFGSGFRKCGLHPFSEDALDYSKLMEYDSTDSTRTQPAENNHSSRLEEVAPQTSEQNNLSFLEKLLNPDCLKKFNNNFSEEWSGAPEYKELYNLWRGLKNNHTNVSINIDVGENDDACQMTNDASDHISAPKEIAEIIIEKNVSNYNSFDNYAVEDPLDENNRLGTIQKSNSREFDNSLSSLDEVTMEDITKTNQTASKFSEVGDLNLSIPNESCKIIVECISSDDESEDISNFPKDSTYKQVADKTNVDLDIVDKLSGELYETECTNTKTTNSINSVDLINRVNKHNVQSVPVDLRIANKSAHGLCDADVRSEEFNTSHGNAIDKRSSNVKVIDTHQLCDTESVVEDIKNPTANAVFGANGIRKYLFYPEPAKNSKKKKKRSKEVLPFTMTSPEWREQHDMKLKKEQEIIEQKENVTSVKLQQMKIKQEFQEQLNKIKSEKIAISNRIDELHLRIQMNKAEERLLKLQLKSGEHKGAEIKIEEELSNLQKKINEDSLEKSELLEKKKRATLQEQIIKAEKGGTDRYPLKSIN